MINHPLIFFRGYNLSNLSDNDKTQIANNMLKDHNFMNKLNDYQKMLRYIENKYHASAFTKEQFNKIAKFGMDRGIYFLPGLKEKVKKMEEKTLAFIQNKGNSTLCCVCSDRVELANADLAQSVEENAATCFALSEFPPAALFCWAALTAYFLEENQYINSTEYWCNCMYENYGYCVYYFFG
jgi:uncharacterized protein YozE (UPF0346 family)